MADIDPTPPTYRCDRSVCRRNRFRPAIVSPDRSRLLAGDGSPVAYRCNSLRNSHHFFCRTCGLRPFGIGNDTPGDARICGVNPGCLEDVTPEALDAAPVAYVAGAHDRWQQAPHRTRYPSRGSPSVVQVSRSCNLFARLAQHHYPAACRDVP